ncbi:MAG TPA: type II toxin-antitoxin system RelE/ParE family toxin [Candidatus Saccharimonadales bacterium]|jgi:plasmid stabilization system protein ParE|nr:type II toxin-antitoxin system RelE/ParE family toxin [Candidatus Saccharimonadales bacterium]
MTTNQGFELHPEAGRDIVEIWEFIAQDSPLSTFREGILDAIRKLVDFPEQDHIRPDLTSRPLRFQVVRDFRIAYAPDEKPILVIAVVHGRRRPRVMAAILRGRK